MPARPQALALTSAVILCAASSGSASSPTPHPHPPAPENSIPPSGSIGFAGFSFLNSVWGVVDTVRAIHGLYRSLGSVGKIEDSPPPPQKEVTPQRPRAAFAHGSAHLLGWGGGQAPILLLKQVESVLNLTPKTTFVSSRSLQSPLHPIHTWEPEVTTVLGPSRSSCWWTSDTWPRGMHGLVSDFSGSVCPPPSCVPVGSRLLCHPLLCS